MHRASFLPEFPPKEAAADIRRPRAQGLTDSRGAFGLLDALASRLWRTTAEVV